MEKSPRAYYVGGVGVGCGVPRVAVLEKIDANTYRVKVTSRKAYAYKLGEIFTAKDYDLYDRMWVIPGPKCRSACKEWRKRFEGDSV